MWGPLVLAGDIGPEPERRRGRQAGPRPEPPVVPVFVATGQAARGVARSRCAGKPGHFRTAGVGREPTPEGAAHDVELMPFYELHERTYATYWDMYTPDGWKNKQAEYVAEAEAEGHARAASVAAVPVGDFRAERPSITRAETTPETRAHHGKRSGRAARSWFSYDVPVDPSHPMALMVTYFSDDTRNTPASFQIQVDGTKIADANVTTSEPRALLRRHLSDPCRAGEGTRKRSRCASRPTKGARSRPCSGSGW